MKLVFKENDVPCLFNHGIGESINSIFYSYIKFKGYHTKVIHRMSHFSLKSNKSTKPSHPPTATTNNYALSFWTINS